MIDFESGDDMLDFLKAGEDYVPKWVCDHRPRGEMRCGQLIPKGHLHCSRCGEHKPAEEFPINTKASASRGNRHYLCGPCNNARQRANRSRREQ
jgi:hypothetical protein